MSFPLNTVQADPLTFGVDKDQIWVGCDKSHPSEFSCNRDMT